MPSQPARSESFPCGAVRDGVTCTGTVTFGVRAHANGLTYPFTDPCPECEASKRSAAPDLRDAFRYCDAPTFQRIGEELQRPVQRTPGNAAAIDALAQMPDRMAVVLYGSPEAGKTFLALHTVKRLSAAGLRCLYLAEHDLLEAIEATGYESPDRARAQALYDDATTTPVLVLDDLGMARHVTPRSADHVERLLWRRYAAGLHLVLTTNLAEPEMDRRLGPRAASRIAEIAGRSVLVTGRWRTGR